MDEGGINSVRHMLNCTPHFVHKFPLHVGLDVSCVVSVGCFLIFLLSLFFSNFTALLFKLTEVETPSGNACLPTTLKERATIAHLGSSGLL
jgi:hypothetical protein